MEDIKIVSESTIKIEEIKEEPIDYEEAYTFNAIDGDERCSVKTEVESDAEEELEPPARVDLKEEPVESGEELEQGQQAWRGLRVKAEEAEDACGGRRPQETDPLAGPDAAGPLGALPFQDVGPSLVKTEGPSAPAGPSAQRSQFPATAPKRDRVNLPPANAAQGKYNKLLQQKLQIQSTYYRRKLKILGRSAKAHEKAAEALGKAAEAHENAAEALATFAFKFLNKKVNCVS